MPPFPKLSDEMDALRRRHFRRSEDSVHRLLNVRVEMNRVNDLNILIAQDDVSERAADSLESRSEILAAMPGHEDQALRRVEK